MKIIYLHQYFVTPQMSGGTRSYEMAQWLARVGHEVHVVTSDRSPIIPSNKGWYETFVKGIRVHWLPVPYSNKLCYNHRIKVFFEFAFKAAIKAASLSGDVVFATSTPLTIALPGIYAAKRNRIPMVFEVRDLWPKLPISMRALKNPALIFVARQLEKFAYRYSSRIVALSPGMKNGITATGYTSEKVSIITNICDLELFNVPSEQGEEFRSQYSWLGTRPLVVYTGTLGVINGVDYLAYLAKAAIKIDPEVRFLVVGTGKEEEKVRKTADELGVLKQNFFMMPQVAKNEIPKILCAASIATSLFIDLKEMWDNSANKFFDALASGTPVAINYGGWQADILRQTGAGIVLDVNKMKIKRTAETLIQKIRDKKWLKYASDAAKKMAREEFSKDVLAAKLEQVLIDAAQERI